MEGYHQRSSQLINWPPVPIKQNYLTLIVIILIVIIIIILIKFV